MPDFDEQRVLLVRDIATGRRVFAFTFIDGRFRITVDGQEPHGEEAELLEDFQYSKYHKALMDRSTHAEGAICADGCTHVWALTIDGQEYLDRHIDELPPVVTDEVVLSEAWQIVFYARRVTEATTIKGVPFHRGDVCLQFRGDANQGAAPVINGGNVTEDDLQHWERGPADQDTPHEELLTSPTTRQFRAKFGLTVTRLVSGDYRADLDCSVPALNQPMLFKPADIDRGVEMLLSILDLKPIGQSLTGPAQPSSATPELV